MIHSTPTNIQETQSDEKLTFDAIFRIQTHTLQLIQSFLMKEHLVQLMPVLLSPITDPLNHSVFDATIDYQTQKLKLTKSMIFHKQVAIAQIESPGLFIFSPNVRLEKTDSGRHLLEFTQVDIELREGTQMDFMALIERMIEFIFAELPKYCQRDLEKFHRDLKPPKRPFARYTTNELFDQYGDKFEQITSEKASEPFWILDHRREFYDKEEPTRPGHYINYDLIYPEGYGEALSGGERDYEYQVLLRKIEEREQNPADFEFYLAKAQQGQLIPSAGGGLGIERLIRFLTKQPHIRNIRLFPRSPGDIIHF